MKNYMYLFLTAIGIGISLHAADMNSKLRLFIRYQNKPNATFEFDQNPTCQDLIDACIKEYNIPHSELPLAVLESGVPITPNNTRFRDTNAFNGCNAWVMRVKNYHIALRGNPEIKEVQIPLLGRPNLERPLHVNANDLTKSVGRLYPHLKSMFAIELLESTSKKIASYMELKTEDDLKKYEIVLFKIPTHIAFQDLQKDEEFSTAYSIKTKNYAPDILLTLLTDEETNSGVGFRAERVWFKPITYGSFKLDKPIQSLLINDSETIRSLHQRIKNIIDPKRSKLFKLEFLKNDVLLSKDDTMPSYQKPFLCDQYSIKIDELTRIVQIVLPFT